MREISETLNESQLLLIEEVNEEYTKGFSALNALPDRTVTFYGGGRIKPESQTYKLTCQIAEEFAKLGWGVVSGGGPGIMSASLEGAHKGGGEAIAFRINIKGEPPAQNVDVDVLFKHFSVRKYLLRQSDVLIYCPGGFGTLDELMETLTLIVTHKHSKKPIYLLDSMFWKDYIEWFETILFKDRGTVGEDFESFFKVVDTADDIMRDLFS
jgi:uncharacterized protein (TIGR00730 family)